MLMFPVLFGQNECVHRILRSILSQNQPVSTFWCRFDFVEISPRSSEFSILFDFCSIFWSFSDMVINVLKTNGTF